MKKLFSVVLMALMVMSTTAFAGPRFGLRGALNLASAKVSPLGQGVSVKSILGFSLGGAVEAPISQDQSLALRGEVTWTEKGMKLSFSNGAITCTYDELDLSPFLVYNISGLLSNARPFIMGGPELGFVLSTNAHTEITGGTTSDEEITGAASSNFGLNLGAGVGFPLANRGEIVADLRYGLGLSDAGTTVNNTAVKVKLRSFLIGVGYNFPTKK